MRVEEERKPYLREVFAKYKSGEWIKLVREGVITTDEWVFLCQQWKKYQESKKDRTQEFIDEMT